jgi:hypothetical protein
MNHRRPGCRGCAVMVCNLERCRVASGLRACSNCGVSKYCSSAHEREDRPRHAQQCAYLQTLRDDVRREIANPPHDRSAHERTLDRDRSSRRESSRHVSRDAGTVPYTDRALRDTSRSTRHGGGGASDHRGGGDRRAGGGDLRSTAPAPADGGYHRSSRGHGGHGGEAHGGGSRHRGLGGTTGVLRDTGRAHSRRAPGAHVRFDTRTPEVLGRRSGHPHHRLPQEPHPRVLRPGSVNESVTGDTVYGLSDEPWGTYIFQVFFFFFFFF